MKYNTIVFNKFNFVRQELDLFRLGNEELILSEANVSFHFDRNGNDLA